MSAASAFPLAEALMVGLVNKPLLPDIPNIEDKEVFLFHLM